MKLWVSFLVWLPLVATVWADAPKTVPLMQAIPLPYQQVSFQRDGVELCRYHFGSDLRRPFIFPVIGPSGRSLTRMGHPHEPVTHSHHNSIWISHNDVNGLSFWEDRGKGRIVHEQIESLEDSDAEATLIVLNSWMNETNHRVLLTERRCLRVRPLPNREWLLLMDVELQAKDSEVTLGKTPFGLVGVRMAKTIGVNDGGGTIRNSEGGVGENQIFWKHARWVDYSGPITATAIEGVTLLDHPANPNHPAGFHVRSDGWMGASLNLDGARVLKLGEPLKLRYGFYVHTGQPGPDALNQQWQAFTETSPAPPPVKGKPSR